MSRSIVRPNHAIRVVCGRMIPSMSSRYPLSVPLPTAADAAIRVARQLREAGHEALLAGGCVRDLLLQGTPKDYDVATNATPERVSSLFRPTRQVGAAFGVVLVRCAGVWIEVATFRSDGHYADGRRPTSVTFTDAEHDAQRRDFTVNGMFLDPVAGEVIDYVGGRADLHARLIRCIGDADRRFDEDYLRMLRAVRFAARLKFEIEATTQHAIRRHASRLENIAAERVREELEKMFDAESRADALRWLIETNLIGHLWPGAGCANADHTGALALVQSLGSDARLEATMAVVIGADVQRADAICRLLTFSNDQRELITWLIAHCGDLDRPDELTLAALKRLLAHRGFGQLCALSTARNRNASDWAIRMERRIAAIDPDSIAPAPLVTGQDLIDRNVAAGPIFRQLLDALYTEQLDEKLVTRADALARLNAMLASRR